MSTTDSSRPGVTTELTATASTGWMTAFVHVETSVERAERHADFCADMAMRHGLLGHEDLALSWSRTADVHAFTASQLQAIQHFADSLA